MFPPPRQNGVNDLATPLDDIRRIAAPVLLIHGREDKVIRSRPATSCSRSSQTRSLHVFGHCGHWTQIERMAEFNAIVDSFLTGPSRA